MTALSIGVAGIVAIFSFREITNLFPALLIDAASAVIQVGWFKADGSVKWETSESESGVGVFQCVERLGVDPQEAAAFVF